MGNSSSKPLEIQVMECANNNDLAVLQRLINHHQAQGTFNPAVHLEWVDKEGRTPLIVAAAKNHYQLATLLLNSGANVHHVNSVSEPRGGTALHEATRNRNEAMAELLLSRGATPFQCNVPGRTCLDEALLVSHLNLLRKYEQGAPFRGVISIKAYKFAGLSQPFKSRYMVVVPLLPVQPRTGPPKPVRRQLWIFKDAGSLELRCRVWLDGATMVRTSTNETVLRLHPAHKPPPGDVTSRYDRGYCLYMRTADASATASAALEALLQHVNNPGVPSVTNQAYPALPVPGMPGGMTPTHTPPLSTHPSGPAPDSPQVNRPGPGHYSTGSMIAGNQDFVDTLHALPGESDVEFASRLASTMSATTLSSNPSYATPPSSSLPPAPRPPSAPPSQSYPGLPAPGASASSAAAVGPHATGATPWTGFYPAVPSAGIEVAPALPAPAPPAPALPAPVPSLVVAPSAPAPPSDAGEDSLCVICLSANREAGYLHGATLHRCVCKDCCDQVQIGQPCPLCRQPVERVVGVF